MAANPEVQEKDWHEAKAVGKRIYVAFVLICIWLTMLGVSALGPPFVRGGPDDVITYPGWRETVNPQPETDHSRFRVGVVLGFVVMILVPASFIQRVTSTSKKVSSKRFRRALKMMFLMQTLIAATAISLCTYSMATKEDPWVVNAAREDLIVWFGLSGIPLAGLIIGLVHRRIYDLGVIHGKRESAADVMPTPESARSNANPGVTK